MVHAFQRAGMYLALDAGSGAVHVLDAPAFDLLCALSEADIRTQNRTAIPPELACRHAGESLAQALAELARLTEEGTLFAPDDYTEFASALGLAPVKAMCLHLAHDCNLRCRYCFASTGGFGGQRKLMPFNVAKSAIDMLVKLSGERCNLEVDFFGGEPLMNFDVLKQTVDYARSIESNNGKRFRFTVTTNGMSLNDEMIDYINREMDNAVLSLDGRRSVNDDMRLVPGGGSAFDAVVPSFQKLVQTRAGKDYYVRGTYTKRNLDFDRDVLALHALGFGQISVEPVVTDPAQSYAISTEDLDEIEQSYERIMQDMINRASAGNGGPGYNFFHFMLDLDNGPCAIKRLKGCGSGNEYVAVTPEGDIYPCHQFVGDTSFLMGSVLTGELDTERKAFFAQANLFHKPDCAACWAKFFCSGGCNANNHQYEGSVFTPHKLSCQLEKLRLECAIALQAANALNAEI